MGILIISDSHGLRNELSEIVARHKRDVATFIHCGDSELSVDAPELAPFYVVKGNCDFFAKFPTYLIVEADGLKIFVTHGHLYGVKSSLAQIYQAANEAGCQVACFGHSHETVIRQADDVLMINPGSIKMPRMRMEKTYMIMEVAERNIAVRLYDIDGVMLETTQL